MVIWPRALPDETLFSVAAQQHLLTAKCGQLHCLRDVFGCQRPFLSGGFPSHLRQLANYLRPTQLWSDSRIVETFTFIPYIGFFYDEATVNEIHDLALSSDGRGIKVRLGWVASRLGAAEYIRGCPICVAADFRDHGRPYWHRSHHLPGVEACHIHKIKLVPADYSPEDTGRFQVFLPTAAIAHADRFPSNDFAVRFAEWSHDFLCAPPPSIGALNLRDLYRSRLNELGFVTQNGRIRQREYQSWATQLLSDRTARNVDWLSKIVRKPRNQLHPSLHIRLLMTMFGTMDELRAYLASPAQLISCDSPARSNIAMAGLNYPSLSLRQLSRVGGCSVTTLAVSIARQGGRVARRPKVLNEALLNTIKNRLTTNVPIDDIAKELRISIATVYRVLRSDKAIGEKRRHSLLEYECTRRQAPILQWLTEHPGATKSDLDARFPADIPWLRRHDGRWLQEITARCAMAIRVQRGRVDWESRDRCLLRDLSRSYDKWILMPGKPVRITAALLARETGASDNLQKYPHRLPLSTRFLQQHVESQNSFHGRRLHWAAAELTKRRDRLSLRSLVRYAGCQ